MAIMEITVVPVGTGSTSLSGFVAEVVRTLDDTGLKYQITPMGTVVEGELALLLATAARMHEKPFTMGAKRVATTIKIDDRRDKPLSMEAKVRAVAEKLAY